MVFSEPAFADDVYVPIAVFLRQLHIQFRLATRVVAEDHPRTFPNALGNFIGQSVGRNALVYVRFQLFTFDYLSSDVAEVVGKE